MKLTMKEKELARSSCSVLCLDCCLLCLHVLSCGRLLAPSSSLLDIVLVCLLVLPE